MVDKRVVRTEEYAVDAELEPRGDEGASRAARSVEVKLGVRKEEE